MTDEIETTETLPPVDVRLRAYDELLCRLDDLLTLARVLGYEPLDSELDMRVYRGLSNILHRLVTECSVIVEELHP